MLNGVDIASHQAGIKIANLTDTDFVIVKTSGGVGYRNPYATDMLSQAKASGKLIGTYHYAREKGCKGTAKAEAAYYVESTKPYIGEAILCLDWEEECSLGTGWAKEWLDEVYRLTGVRPLVYTSQSVCAYWDWSAVVNAGYKLWLAQYASMDPVYGWQSLPWQSGSLGAWNTNRYVMHQYGTGYISGWSSRIDMDLFYGDKNTWKSLAAKSGQGQAQPAEQPKTTSKVTADDIIKIMFGWEGLSMSNQSHRPIVDLYNSYKPLAVGYTVTYWDSYCDTTVSAAFIKANAVDLIGGTECGVERHVKLFKSAGIWIEDGSIAPKKGDIIVFNWDESQQPNDGFADHIGIVYNCEKGIIYTIEGNAGEYGTVMKRAYSVGNGNIRGFARPKYGTASQAAPTPVVVPTQPSEQAQKPINKTPQWTGKITADVLNIRTWAGTENPNLISYPTLKYGTIVEVCDIVKASDGKDWYYIKISGNKGEKYGFASAAYIAKQTNTTTGMSINPPNKQPQWVGMVNGNLVNIRKGAGVEYANLISYPTLVYGCLVDVCDKVKDVDGEDWYYIRIDGPQGYKFGFIFADFITRV